MVDEAKLHQFVGQMLNDLGGAISIGLVQLGDALMNCSQHNDPGDSLFLPRGMRRDTFRYPPLSTSLIR
jgi:hypothetical protein